MSEITPDSWAIFLGKVNRCAHDVTEGYEDLLELVTPRKGAGGGPGSSDPFPQAPIDLAVVDLLCEIDTEASRLKRAVCKALNIRPQPHTGPCSVETRSTVQFLAHAVPTLWRDARAIAEDVVDTLWMLAGSVRRYTAPKASYLTVKACGECGECAVMVDPNHGRARCAACGHLTLAVDVIRP